MAPAFATRSLLLALFFTAAVAAPPFEGCDCESPCVGIVARQRKEIRRLQAEVRSLRGILGPDGRRAQGPLTCDRNWMVTSNAEVEAFQLEGCRAVKNLTITGRVTSLAGFSSLETAKNVHIKGEWWSSLKVLSLVGLENLRHVEKTLEVGSTIVTSLAGLRSLESAGELKISANAGLESLTGLESLVRVEGQLYIASNDNLLSLTGLQNLVRVGGTLKLRWNRHLLSLNGLQGLETARAVEIEYNRKLQSLAGLEKLTRVEGKLSIQDNDQLGSLTGLHGLETAGAVHIKDIPGLQSLTGLEKLTRVDRLVLINNDQLRSLTGLHGLETVHDISITAHDQLQSPIGLENLARVEGKLDVTENKGLRSFTGLQGLQYAGEVAIRMNDELQSLTGLESLARVEGLLWVHWNPKLRSFTGLQGLESAGWVFFEQLSELKSLSGLKSLTRVDDEMHLFNNPGLESLTGLESLVQVGALILEELDELRSIAALRNLTSVWHGGIIIKTCPKLHSLQGLGTLHRASQLLVQSTPLDFLGGPFAPGSSIHRVYFDERSQVRCLTQHEHMSLHSVMEVSYNSSVPDATWQPECGPDFGTFSCTKGHPCIFSLAGKEGNYTSVFISGRFTGCGVCSANHPHGDVAEGGTVDLGYVLRNEEAGLHSVCRCAGGTGPVAQLFLRGPTQSEEVKECSRGRNCSFTVKGEALQRSDRVVLMSSCSSNPSSGFAPNWTADKTYLLHDPSTWYDAPPTKYQVCWRAPCTSAPDGPTCPTPEDSYIQAGELVLFGAYPRNYWQVLGEESPFSVLNIGFGVADGDRMRLRRACGETDEEEDYVLTATSWGMVFDFGRLTEERARAGKHHLCSCQERDGEQCNAAWHFRADAGVVEIRCPAGQELVDSRRCEMCPAGTHQPEPGLDPCLECPVGQFSWGANEMCEACPVGAVAGRAGSSACVACKAWQSADSQAARCSPDLVVLVLLALFYLFVGAFFAILVSGIRKRLSVVDVSLVQDETIVTTFGSHGLTNVGRPSFPVKLQGTGHPNLDSPSRPFRARVRDAVRLELLTLGGESINSRLDTSMGTLTVSFPYALAVGKLLQLLDFFYKFIRDRNAYYLDSNITKQLTKASKISYAELVGAGEVEWFVSHFWGTPFEHFCAALKKHAEMFCGERDWKTLRYWVSFCSNNQYQIKEELGGEAGWVESSFYLALQSKKCLGTCMVLDDKAMPLTRVWCIFELLQTVKLERTNAAFQGLLLCTSSGILNTGGGSPEVAVALAEKVAGMNLETAQASSASDASMIRDQVIREMGSLTALNLFICRQMHAMLVRAQQHANQHFVDVLAQLDLAMFTNSDSQ